MVSKIAQITNLDKKRPILMKESNICYGMYFGNSLLTEVVAQFCKAKFYFQVCAAVRGSFIL